MRREVLWVILPSDEDATLPLDPCEEALNHPPPCVSPQPAVHLGWQACCDCITACFAGLWLPTPTHWYTLTSNVFRRALGSVQILSHI